MIRQYFENWNDKRSNSSKLKPSGGSPTTAEKRNNGKKLYSKVYFRIVCAFMSFTTMHEF